MLNSLRWGRAASCWLNSGPILPRFIVWRFPLDQGKVAHVENELLLFLARLLVCPLLLIERADEADAMPFADELGEVFAALAPDFAIEENRSLLVTPADIIGDGKRGDGFAGLCEPSFWIASEATD